MLLHELQHYRYKDNISNYLLLLTGIFYWFNPLVWLAARAMKNDREIACDSAVLNILDNTGQWDLYNMDMATTRTAPDSTYKYMTHYLHWKKHRYTFSFTLSSSYVHSILFL